ncbi:hypothetical protein [Candidatus Poriferisodalis sp.]|uniref:hypothetical protein n=1 Tax=Candidatus Poriferisodalis sp. TaxID=3101277 RepID=UPI003B590BEA
MRARPGGVAGTAVVGAACAAGLYEWANADFESLLSKNRQNDDSGTDNSGDHDSGTDGDSNGTDDDSDSGTDDGGSSEEGEDPEPTPGICDRNSAPTNPYKIGPSNTTPQQWTDWYAWFDGP